MPKGVYDRSKMKRRQPDPGNGNRAYSPTVEDMEDLTPTSTNHEPPVWGQPYETNAADIEAKPSPWEDLYSDVMLRLERTSESKAVVYPFKADHDADRAYEAINRRSRKRHGAGFVVCGVRRNPPRLFVRRGPNWHK